MFAIFVLVIGGAVYYFMGVGQGVLRQTRTPSALLGVRLAGSQSAAATRGAADKVPDDRQPAAAPQAAQPQAAPTAPEAPSPSAAPPPTGAEPPPPSAAPPPTGAEPPPLLNYKPDFSKFKFDPERGEMILGDVKDGTESFDEAALYFMLRTCRELSATQFAPDPPDKEVTFEQLWTMPESFRGQAVTVSGLVGLVVKWKTPQPELVGLDHFWVVEIFKPVKSDAKPVCTLIVLDDPGQLPQAAPVRAKAYFYKIRAYDKQYEDPDTHERAFYTEKCPIVVGKYLVVAKEPLAGPGLVPKALNVFAIPLVVQLAALLVLAVLLSLFVRRMLARRRDLVPAKQKKELTPDELAKRIKFLEEQEKSGRGAGSPTGDNK
jgi:hypothetical protein